MNTPAHLLIGWAAFGRKASPMVQCAALAGALMPDLSLYVLAGVSLFVLNISPSVVFGELYYSNLWQSIFAVDNSFVIWGAALLLAAVSKRPAAIAFCGAGLLHLALDFPLHHDDGRAHFWPITDWIFQSPVSYWDHQHFAGVVGPVEAALALGCAILLCLPEWQRWRSAAVGALMALELLAVAPGFFISF